MKIYKIHNNKGFFSNKCITLVQFDSLPAEKVDSINEFPGYKKRRIDLSLERVCIFIGKIKKDELVECFTTEFGGFGGFWAQDYYKFYFPEFKEVYFITKHHAKNIMKGL